MVKSMREKTEEYDAELVRYCPRCYSLKIGYEEAIGSDCCLDCGCSDTAETTIGEWEKMYEKRYGKTYITHEKDVRNTPLFKCSIADLKMKLAGLPSYRDLVLKMYPSFPSGYDKADTILLFFDRLSRDGRIDELRIILLNLK